MIIFDYHSKNIVQVPGVYVAYEEKPGIHAIVTLTDTEELCYVPETQNLVRKKRERSDEHELFYTFLDIHLIGPDADEVCLQHL